MIMIINSTTLLGKVMIILLGMVSTYIIFDFMGRFGRILYYKKYVYIIAYIVFIAAIFGTNFISNSLVNIGVNLIGTIVIGHFLYNNSKMYILYYSIFIIFLCCFEIIVAMILQCAYNFFNINFISVDLIIITDSIIMQFINFSASRLFILCFRKKNIEKITPVQYLNFLILPSFSIFYIITLMIYLQTYVSTDEIILFVVNIVFIILLNLYVINVFESISKNNILKNDLALYEEKSKLQYQYYSDLENKYKRSRKVIHDMKNHLQAIEHLYHLKENEMASKYTTDMYQILEGLEQKYYTSNRVLNIIINDKVQKAEALDINVKCQIGDIELDFIRDIDLTTIFANLFDNAIEACTKVESNRYINFKIDKFNEFIVMTLSNCSNGFLIEKDGRFISQKKNHEAIGLMNVKKVLEIYEGNIKIQYNENEFKVNIMIPII